MVHIRWAFNFSVWNPTRTEWTFCNQCIQNEERERIKKFYFKKDAKAAMVNMYCQHSIINKPIKAIFISIQEKSNTCVHVSEIPILFKSWTSNF